MIKKVFPLVFIVFAACSHVPFTQAFKNTITKADSTAVGKIQYYIDKPIVLERTTSAEVDSFTVVNGVFNNGLYKQVVKIKGNTKAVCKNVNSNRQIAVVGPEANEELIFVNNGNEYMLNAFNKKVMYGGIQYNVVKGANARLMITKKTMAPKKSIKTAKGMKLKEE